MTIPEIIIIAAVANNGVIGCDGRLPWRIKPDLLRFQMLTRGYPVIMGRKTWDSLGQKPLRQRLNIIISNNILPTAGINIDLDVFDTPIFTNTPQMALRLARRFFTDKRQVLSHDKIFIIGGSSIYSTMLPHTDRIMLTKVHTDVVGDSKFPELNYQDWIAVSREDHLGTCEPGPSGANYSYIEYITK